MLKIAFSNVYKTATEYTGAMTRDGLYHEFSREFDASRLRFVIWIDSTKSDAIFANAVEQKYCVSDYVSYSAGTE